MHSPRYLYNGENDSTITSLCAWNFITSLRKQRVEPDQRVVDLCMCVSLPGRLWSHTADISLVALWIVSCELGWTNLNFWRSSWGQTRAVRNAKGNGGGAKRFYCWSCVEALTRSWEKGLLTLNQRNHGEQRCAAGAQLYLLRFNKPGARNYVVLFSAKAGYSSENALLAPCVLHFFLFIQSSSFAPWYFFQKFLVKSILFCRLPFLCELTFLFFETNLKTK